MSAPSLRPIVFGRPGEGIGKKDLVAVIQRFKNLHRLKLQHIQSQLSPRQRGFLELLPLLFHVNHPLLPGYVDSETPAGIPDYTPGRATLLRAARLSRSFEFKRRALLHYPIHGLFLMGSVGSIAYSGRSDLDIWLCHAPELTPDELAALRQKACLVEQWASELGLEAHIFFIEAESFRAGRGEPISTESCGSIQHHLLLEEFYRTSLHLAGRVPAWWLVPPEQDEHYDEYLAHLQGKRFINSADLIDLGGLENLTADEFLGGTLWHLYKSIGAPHKSLLKLLLMESYASEFPHPQWLCTRLKRAVYAGNLDPTALDSYILMYRKVEDYLLERGEMERLELARQCFYMKLNELPTQPALKHHRRHVLQSIVASWGWSPALLAELDNRRRCRIAQALAEHLRIGRELARAYQSVSHFARQHAYSMQKVHEEIVLLGRRLYAAIEQKPNKVERLAQDLWDELLPEELALCREPLADGGWGWSLRPLYAPQAEPLKRARRVLEILTWLSLNGFWGARDALSLAGELPPHLDLGVIKRCLHAVTQFLDRHARTTDTLQPYGAPPRIEASALFFNLEEVTNIERKDGLVVTSNRFDPFSFGAGRTCLVASIDQIKLTSWQEVLIERHLGLEGLFTAYCELLDHTLPNAPAPELEHHCFASAHAHSLVTRAYEVFRQLAESSARHPATRHVIRGGEAFFLFERREPGWGYRVAHDETDLLQLLGEPRPRFASVTFDRLALENSPLPLIFTYNRAGVIQLFAYPQGPQCEIYVLDERGSLFHRLHRDTTPRRMFAAYALFFSAIQQHTVTQTQGLEFFLLERTHTGEWRAESLEERPQPTGRQLSVRIHGLELEPGHLAFTVYCNEVEFSSMTFGDQVFARAAAHILALRQRGENYPIHITDIDAPPHVLGAPDHASLQSIHFLHYKRKLEDRLNV